METNPFLSHTYTSIWLDYFGAGKEPVSFDFIPEIEFLKHPVLPFYYNVGAARTKGFTYTLIPKHRSSYKNKTFLLYDVLGYKEVPNGELAKLGRLHLPQYMGYLCNLEKYRNAEEYMQEVISKRSQSKFRSYLRKLEVAYAVNYQYYGKDSSNEQIQHIFKLFRILLHKRFAEKKRFNHNLPATEWAFHFEVSKRLIHQNKAGLFVIEAGDKPIFITLMYFSDRSAIDVMRVFDTDFAKYRPGSIGNIKQIDWCIQNDFRILDFSKGHFEYKKRWSNTPYFYKFHIYFDQKSIKARSMAYVLYGYYRLKDLLRQIELDVLWQKMKYRLK